MPRIVFGTVEEFSEWARANLVNLYYKVYYTYAMEIICRPVRNPQNHDFAYYSAHDADNEKEAFSVVRECGLIPIKIKSFEWRIDQPVGVRTPLVE